MSIFLVYVFWTSSRIVKVVMHIITYVVPELKYSVIFFCQYIWPCEKQKLRWAGRNFGKPDLRLQNLVHNCHQLDIPSFSVDRFYVTNNMQHALCFNKICWITNHLISANLAVIKWNFTLYSIKMLLHLDWIRVVFTCAEHQKRYFCLILLNLICLH